MSHGKVGLRAREQGLLRVLAANPLQWEPLSAAIAFIQERYEYGHEHGHEDAFAHWKLLVDRGSVCARENRENLLRPRGGACSSRISAHKDGLFLMDECRAVSLVESNVAELRAATASGVSAGKKKARRGRPATQQIICRTVFEEKPELQSLAGKQLYRSVVACLKEKWPNITLPSQDTVERARDTVASSAK